MPRRHDTAAGGTRGGACRWRWDSRRRSHLLISLVVRRTDRPTFLVVSPHLDDAVLSYGARLAELNAAGHEVLVYTVFAGTPDPPYPAAAERFHRLWGIDGDPVHPRRHEDRSALALLGATPLHGEYLDAIYRTDEDGRWLLDGGLPLDHQGSAEPGLVTDIASTVARLIAEHKPVRVATCAAVGNHVDHQRARDAAVLASVGAAVPVILWTDVPYVGWTDAIPPLPAGLACTAATAETVGTVAWEAKLQAVACYASQLAMLSYDGVGIFDHYDRQIAAWHAASGISGYCEVVRGVRAAECG
jgi:LmbE family N-acetylglucosaminyl deacetylase